MKKILGLTLGLLALNLTTVFGQGNFIANTSYQWGQPNQVATNLTKFNLDFPGGTPAELVASIEKATGKPLNAIIPDEDADTKLPALKLSNITFSQLSATLYSGSFKSVYIRNSNFTYATVSVGYYFKTTDNVPSDNSVWFFYDEKLPPAPSPQKTCRFYQLAPYLDRGLTVDDITTAIQTGWKMMGNEATPEISFHKETKLLIAVGEPEKLEVIDNVLKALQPSPPDPTAMFQERLQQLRKNEEQNSTPTAIRPRLTPEAQVNLLEQNRMNGQRATTNLPPPIKPEAGQ